MSGDPLPDHDVAFAGSTPLRLAVISTQEGAPWGGSEALWAATAGVVLEQGWKVLLSLKRWPETPEAVSRLSAAGAELHLRNPRGRAARAAPRLARRVRPALRSVIQWRPDVVFVSLGGTYDLTYDIDVLRDLKRLRAGGVPVLAFCNGGDDFAVPDAGQREAALSAFHVVSKVFFTCRSHKETTERQLATEFPDAGMLRNPIKISGPVPYPQDGTLQMACVGALDVRAKGQDLLLDALASSRWLDRDWHLNLYGSGPDESYLRQLVGMYGLASRVSFPGHVQPAHIWEHCHVLVMASRKEGLPLVIQEAALAGRPTVATDVGGNAELVRNGRSGFLAAGPTERALADALEELWQHRASLPGLGAQAAADCAAYRTGDPELELLQHLSAAAASRACVD